MYIDAAAVNAAFAADGTATGTIQVASTTGFYAGAQGYLTDSTNTRNARCVIVAITDATHLVARVIADDNEQQLAKQIYGAGGNLSTYTLANASKIWMPAQQVRVEIQTTAPAQRNV